MQEFKFNGCPPRGICSRESTNHAENIMDRLNGCQDGEDLLDRAEICGRAESIVPAHLTQENTAGAK